MGGYISKTVDLRTTQSAEANMKKAELNSERSSGFKLVINIYLTHICLDFIVYIETITCVLIKNFCNYYLLLSVFFSFQISSSTLTFVYSNLPRIGSWTQWLAINNK